MSKVDVNAIINHRINEAVFAEKQRNERSLSQFVLSETARIEQSKLYYENKINDLVHQLEDCKKRLEYIPAELESIPAKASEKRIMYERDIIKYTELITQTITNQVKYEIEQAERNRVAREQAEWNTNV